MNKRLKHKISAILCIAMLFGSVALYGQRPLDIGEVKVVAPYVPTVSDAFKINDNPRLDDIVAEKPTFIYNVMPRPLATRFDLEPIVAARMRGEPLAKLYQGHFRGGFGTYTTPYAEAFYNTLRSNDYSMGVHLKHLSSAGTIKNYGFSGFSDNLAHVYGKRFMGDNTLSGGLRYDRNVIHYYGFNPNDYEGDPVLEPYLENLTNKDIRQRINQLNTNIGFGSHHPDSSRFGFFAGLEHNWLSDIYDATEHNLRFNGRIGREIQDPTGMADMVYLNLNTLADIYYNVNPADTSTTGLVSLLPAINARLSRVKLFAGLNLTFQSDTASYFRVYPDLGFEAELIDRHLIVHGRFSGGLERNSLKSLLQENPFINTRAARPAFQNTRTQITAGLRGAFTDQISYNLKVSSAEIDNFALFVTDTANLLLNQFTTVFDNIRRLHVRGELFSQFGTRFHARLSTDYFQYSLDQEIEAWHLPTLQLGLNLKYNMQDKIILSVDVFARNATFGREFDDTMNTPRAVKLHDVFVDGNIGLEYRYTKVLSFFVNFYNVQNKSLERWMNYPTQKFQVLGGLTWSF